MTTPNRYDGNGKVLPDGTIHGRWVMRKGRWTLLGDDRLTMIGDSITWGGLKGTAKRFDWAGWAIYMLMMFTALGLGIWAFCKAS